MYETIGQEALEGAGGHDCASLSFNLQVQDALEDGHGGGGRRGVHASIPDSGAALSSEAFAAVVALSPISKKMGAAISNKIIARV